MYVYICMCLCMYVYIYIHTHTHTYTCVCIYRLRTSVGAFFGVQKRSQTPLKCCENGWTSTAFLRANTGGVT